MHADSSCSCHNHKRLWLGLVLFVSGAIFYLQMFEVIPQETWSYVWPGLLLLTGLKMMATGSCSCTSMSKPMPDTTTPTAVKTSGKKKR